jgi:hypothetical protein
MLTFLINRFDTIKGIDGHRVKENLYSPKNNAFLLAIETSDHGIKRGGCPNRKGKNTARGRPS